MTTQNLPSHLEATVSDLRQASARLAARRSRRRLTRTRLTVVVLAAAVLSTGVASAATGHGVFTVFRSAGVEIFGFKGGSHAGYPNVLKCPRALGGVVTCAPGSADSSANTNADLYRLVGLVKTTTTPTEILGGGAPAPAREIWCAHSGGHFECQPFSGVPPSHSQDAIYRAEGQ